MWRRRERGGECTRPSGVRAEWPASRGSCASDGWRGMCTSIFTRPREVQRESVLAVGTNPRPPQEHCSGVPCRSPPCARPGPSPGGGGARASSPKVSQVLPSRRFTRPAKVIQSYLSSPKGAVPVFTSFSPAGEASSSLTVASAPQVISVDLFPLCLEQRWRYLTPATPVS